MKNEIEGIVLRKTDIRDADAMLSVLSRDGKESILARGVNKIKSKNAYGCQLFTYSRFYLLSQQSKAVYQLKNLECIHSFRHIRENLMKQSIAFVILEILDKVELPDLEFGFDELLFFLEKLDQSVDDYCLLSLFLANITNQIGINPNVDHCCKCGEEKGIKAFSIHDGGFICENCYEINVHQKMELLDLKRIRAVYKAKIFNFDSLSLIGPWNYSLIHLQMRLLNEYSGLTIKSAEFLECLHSHK